MSVFRAFVRLGWRARFLYIEAGCWLFLANLILWIFPFRWVKPMLRARWGHHTSPPPHLAERLGHVLRTAAKHAPWRTTCLVQALAGKMMLALRGFRGTVFIGVAKEGSNQFHAHAWLKSGDTYITGGSERPRFTTIAGFNSGGNT